MDLCWISDEDNGAVYKVTCEGKKLEKIGTFSSGLLKEKGGGRQITCQFIQSGFKFRFVAVKI